MAAIKKLARDMSPVEFDAVKNTPEQMLARGGRLLQTKTNQVVRINNRELLYLEWLVGERARRAS